MASEQNQTREKAVDLIKKFDVAVLTLQPTRVEYWDSSLLDKARYLYEAAKASITEKAIDPENVEENKAVSVN